MPEAVLFLSPREIELATLVASTQVSSLPVAFLQNQEPAKVWRSTSATSQRIDVTLRQAKACNAIAMAGFNFSSAALWRLKGYADAADRDADIAAVDSGWQSVWPSAFRHIDSDWGPEVALLRVDNDVAYLYWRVEFGDPAVGMTYLDVGRLALDRAVQFTVNFDFESSVGYAPNDVQEPSGYGQIFTDPRPANRAFNLTWSFLGRNEANQAAMEITRLRTMAGDVFCFLDPGEIENFHRWSMQGLFTGRTDYKAMAGWLTDGDGVMRDGWSFNFSLIQKL